MHNIQNLAAIITLLTALINIGVAVGINSFHFDFPALKLEIPVFPLKLIVFFYLELVLAIVFSYGKCRVIILLDELPLAWTIILAPLFLIVPLLSAWTSLFNIEWIFLPIDWRYDRFFSVETLILAVCATCSLGIMFLGGGVLPSLLKNTQLRMVFLFGNGRVDEFESGVGISVSFVLGVSLFLVATYKYIT